MSSLLGSIFSNFAFEELVNTLDGIVWETEVGVSPYKFVSKQAERILGYPLERWLTEPGFWQSILHPDDRKNIGALYAFDKEDKRQDRRLEYRLIAADGRVVWVKDCVTVVFEDGRPVRLRGVMIDITERKNAEQAALESSRLKSELLASTSHDIRTPLNAIVGLTELLFDSKLTKAQFEDVMTIRRSSDALLSLINDILDFSKIEAGKFTLEAVDFSLDDVAGDALQLVSVQAAEKKLELSKEIGAELPEGLRGDPGRLLQVLSNLLSNAVKFTETGGVTLRVRHEGLDGAGRHRVRFEVADSGIGISSEIQGQIFNPFEQGGGGVTRKYGGTGLGLSICKNLVELMGGRIDVASVEGQGSRFWFVLPLERGANVRPRRSAPQNASRASVARKSAPKADTRRILVAEDNLINQQVVTRFFEKLGHKVDSVPNGREALRAIEREPYDVILMDCQMPEMDGYQAAREIREQERIGHRKRVPIVALTAHAFSGDRARCLESGMDEYITKPIAFPALEETVVRLTRDASSPRRRRGSTPDDKITALGALATVKPPPPSDPVSFDPARLASLETLQMPGKPDIVAEVVGFFLRSTPGRLQKMRTLAGDGSLRELGREAHSLKSSAGGVGAQTMAKLCQELEAIGGEADASRVTPQEANGEVVSRLDSLEKEYELVQEKLAAVLEQKARKTS